LAGENQPARLNWREGQDCVGDARNRRRIVAVRRPRTYIA
jgi:hypothetical protein